jgi:hypothetical protein
LPITLFLLVDDLTTWLAVYGSGRGPLTGFTAGTPQDALDTACTIHLASTDQ